MYVTDNAEPEPEESAARMKRRVAMMRELEKHGHLDSLSIQLDALVAAILMATGSGIAGNAAYDAVKATFAKVMGRSKKSGQATTNDQLILLAQLAVQIRCAQLDMNVPQRESLHGNILEPTSTSVTEVRIFADGFIARVRIPAAVVEARNGDMEVTIYKVGPA